MNVEWSSNETFEISGYELETMVNTLTTKLLSPEAQAIIREYETLKLLQQRIQKGIEDGKVKTTNNGRVEEITEG